VEGTRDHHEFKHPTSNQSLYVALSIHSPLGEVCLRKVFLVNRAFAFG